MPNDYTEDLMFWSRLKLFIDDVETHDQPGEEERQMILHNCSNKLNEHNINKSENSIN